MDLKVIEYIYVKKICLGIICYLNFIKLIYIILFLSKYILIDHEYPE